MRHRTRTTRAGFTLIEMLVVVAITAGILALSFPMIGAMRRDTSTSSGVNAITIAVSAARRYATDPQFRFVSTDVNPSNANPNEPGLYSGVAAIFTPVGEIRLAKNDEFATFGGVYLERIGPRIIDPQPAGQPERELSGFRDINIDYILLGSDVGIAGITRSTNFVNANRPPLLIPPPFAVWFDQNGYLITTGQDILTGRDNDYEFVYYDSDIDFDYECDRGRWAGSITPYDPNEYNPNHPDYNDDDDLSNNYDDQIDKYKFPVERLEAVIGVYVYSQEKFDTAVADGEIEPWDVGAGDATDNEDYWFWMKENAELVMFSRQTGMVMRDRDE